MTDFRRALRRRAARRPNPTRLNATLFPAPGGHGRACLAREEARKGGARAETVVGGDVRHDGDVEVLLLHGGEYSTFYLPKQEKTICLKWKYSHLPVIAQNGILAALPDFGPLLACKHKESIGNE